MIDQATIDRILDAAQITIFCAAAVIENNVANKISIRNLHVFIKLLVL